MSGLMRPTDEEAAGVDVQERGNSLRVATNSPHLVSLGCGRLSTAVTIHPIKQGRVTIGSDPSSDICIQGTGVNESHCHIENSHGVVTLYPLQGDTTVDGTRHEQPVRLSQGCMIGIGRSNYLRFNHPAEANLMKSVLPNSRISMAPIHFLPSEGFKPNQADKQQAMSQHDNHFTTHNSYQNHNQNQNPTNENGKDYHRQSGPDQNDIRFSSESSSNEAQLSHNVFTDGHKNLEKELDMTYKELSKRKPPVVPRKTYRELDQISNSSNSDQEVVTQHANTPPKAGGIMSKVSKFEYYVRNSQKTPKNPTNAPQNAELWSPKVFSSNSLTVNTPAKDVLVNRDVPTNYAVNKNQQRVEGNNVTNDLKLQKKIILNENNAVEARNCSYTNVVVKNQVVKIDQMAKSYQGVLSKTQNVERSRSRSPEEAESRSDGHGRVVGKMQVASASFNRNPVFNSPGMQFQGNGSGSSAAELQRKQAQLGRMEDESQKFLEHARLEEILNMFAEFDRTEQNISLGVPTTPTEKKPHNKIITNGSLPRGTHNNLIQTSDGSYRFDTPHSRSDYSPHRVQPPSPSSPSPHNIPRTTVNQINPNHITPNRINLNHKLSNYENIQVLSRPNGISTNLNVQMSQSSQNPQQTDARSIQYSSQHSSYENFNIENQNVITNYTRQFPITELSSPVMIRKIARNAQSSANYIGGSFEKNGLLNSYEYNLPTSEGMQYYRTNDGVVRPNNTMSPYENIALKSNASPFNSIPKSPSAHSPRTRIKTTYAHKNVVSPQHFVFPNSSPQESQITSGAKERDETNFNKDESECCQGIEKQLSLTEDIPMIDDTDDFSNELEMRIARLKPENKKVGDETDEQYNLLDPVNVFNQRRNFEEIRRDLIADIPGLDAIHREIDRDLSESRSRQSDTAKNSLNDALKKISEEMKDVVLVDDVFDETVEVNDVESPQCAGFVQGRSRSDRLEQISKELEMEEREDEGCFKDVSTKLEELRCKRKKVLSEIHKVKCKMTDIRSQEDDILRELEMEKALLQGEYDSEIAILNLEQRKLVSLQDKVRLFEAEARENRVQQEVRQAAQRDKVDRAADSVKRIEKDFSKHDATLEELRNAQEVVETERKVFEDMEFQDLEEEADWLAYREELQNDISALTQKIDSQKSRILNLRFETSNNLNAAVEETKLLQSEYVKMLNRIEELTADLQSVEDEIKNSVMENGSDSIRDRRSFTLEERRSRIKSGDFSPPSSDEDLSNAELFENRKKNLKEKLVSIDQMSRSMIVDLGEKRSIDDLVDIEIDHDRSLQSTECSPNKVILSSNDSSPARVERSVSSDRSKTDSCNDTSPDCKEKKQGFWERNFDSLSRLKSKDKKNKQKQDVMWKSMNENMLFNNENIESEYGSFEKCNSLRSSKRSKEGMNKSGEAKDTTKEEKSLKLSFPSLGKLIKKDSLKKNNEEKVKTNGEIVNNKENIDLNSESQDVKLDESSEIDQKNVKHRYVKNSKSCLTENKYLSKCTKTSQLPISISPERNEEHSIRLTSMEYDDNRDSFADSLEEEVRLIDPMTGNTIRLESIDYNQEMSDIAEESREIGKEMAKEKTELAREMSEIAKERSDVIKEAIEMSKERTELAKGMFRKSAGDEFRRYSGEFLNALADNTKVPSQDDIDRISKVTLDAPLLSKNGDMNSLGRKTLDSLREVEKNRKAMLEQNGCQVMNDEREKISELKKRVQNEAKLQWEENRQLQNSQNSQNSQEGQLLNSQFNSRESQGQPQNSYKSHESQSQQQIFEIKIAASGSSSANVTEAAALSVVDELQEDCNGENTGALDDSVQDYSSLDKQLRHSQTDSFNSTAFIEDGEERGEGGGGLGGGTPLRPVSQLSDLSSENGGLMCGAVEAPRRQRKISNNLSPRTREDLQRPLTRYLPIDQDDLNLRAHIESAGHQVDLCPHIIIDSTSCRGYLHKLGAKFHGWSKRWFVFERSTKTLIYYSDKNEKKPRGGAYFQVIEEVYLDHLNASKSPTPLTTFVIKTRQRHYYLMAPSGQAARIWIDVVFTGAQGYTEYLH